MTSLEKVRTITAEALGLELKEVKPESSFRGDLGADSLDIMQLMIELEEAFGLEIPEDDAQQLFTVGDVTNYANLHSKRFDAMVQ